MLRAATPLPARLAASEAAAVRPKVDRKIFSVPEIAKMIEFPEPQTSSTDETDEEDIFDALDVAFANPFLFGDKKPSAAFSKASPLFSRFGSVRSYHTSSSQDLEQQIGESYPFYRQIKNPDNDPAIDDYNFLASCLMNRLRSLNDGNHVWEMDQQTKQLNGRAGVIANYHQAALAIEASLIGKQPKPNRVSFDGRVEIFCVESDEKKAKGTMVIAKMGNVVGRMFMSENGDNHLTFLSSANYPKLLKEKIDEIDLQKEIVLAYFEDRNLSAKQFDDLSYRILRTSCIADYKYSLIEMANRSGSLKNEMFECRARDQDEAEYGGYEGRKENTFVRSQFQMKFLMELVGAKYKEKPAAQVMQGDVAPLQSHENFTVRS